MPKTSDLAGDKKRPNWVSPAHVARFQDCDERTVREWCKKGLIPEAYQTRGGHWRIRMPLSGRTRDWLHRRSSDWPFEKGKGDMQGNWTPDIVERLMLAGWYHACVAAGASMPPISELEDPYCGDEIEPSTDPLVLQAREIHDQIMERFRDRKYIRFLLLTAEVSKFWRKKHRRPTVAEIAKWMGLSKTAWYRRYKRKDLYDAILVARGQAAPYQIQGRNAKKRGFEALKRQLDQRG